MTASVTTIRLHANRSYPNRGSEFLVAYGLASLSGLFMGLLAGWAVWG